MSKQTHFIRAAAAALALAAALPALADTRVEVRTVKHPYVYYRDHDIYYAPETKTWYWMSDGTWRSGNLLPSESQAYVRSGGVSIELDTERPYERHDYVVTHYKTTPAGAQVTERTETTRAPGEVTTRKEVNQVNPDQSTSKTVTTTTTKHRYVYYGARDIYFAPETRTWYWMADGTWRSGAELPVESRAYVTSGGREIILDTERPYERHSYVIAHYKNKPDTIHRHDDDAEDARERAHDHDEDEDDDD